MSTANTLLQAAADWFAEALKQHVAEHPEQCREWVTDFEAGRAGATVTVEIVPTQQILCGFQIGEKVIVFHRTPLHEKQDRPN